MLKSVTPSTTMETADELIGLLNSFADEMTEKEQSAVGSGIMKQ